MIINEALEIAGNFLAGAGAAINGVLTAWDANWEKLKLSGNGRGSDGRDRDQVGLQANAMVPVPLGHFRGQLYCHREGSVPAGNGEILRSFLVWPFSNVILRST